MMNRQYRRCMVTAQSTWKKSVASRPMSAATSALTGGRPVRFG